MGELACSGKCAKAILFVCNMVVVLAGLALLGVGIWFLADPGTTGYLLQATGGSSYYFMLRAAGGIIVVVGIFLAIVGFAGCWGAIRHKTGCLNCYSIILVILVILQIVAAILAGVFHTQITTGLAKTMTKMLQLAGDPKDDQDPKNVTMTSWDFMQYEFSCCGVKNYTDWRNSYWGNNTAKVLDQKVPDTCCRLNNTDFQNPQPKNRATCNAEAVPDAAAAVNSTQLYNKGCEAKFEDWVSEYMAALIGVAVAVIVIEVAGVILSCLLVSRIKTGYEYV